MNVFLKMKKIKNFIQLIFWQLQPVDLLNILKFQFRIPIQNLYKQQAGEKNFILVQFKIRKTTRFRAQTLDHFKLWWGIVDPLYFKIGFVCQSMNSYRFLTRMIFAEKVRRTFRLLTVNEIHGTSHQGMYNHVVVEYLIPICVFFVERLTLRRIQHFGVS